MGRIDFHLLYCCISSLHQKFGQFHPGAVYRQHDAMGLINLPAESHYVTCSMSSYMYLLQFSLLVSSTSALLKDPRFLLIFLIDEAFHYLALSKIVIHWRISCYLFEYSQLTLLVECISGFLTS